MAAERMAYKRGSFDICADMLRTLDGEFESSVAALALKSNVDSRALPKYLDILVKYKLVTDTRRARIKISDKGRRYLHQYARLVALLE